MFFGVTGPHIVHVVRASDLGATLLAYYRKVIRSNQGRRSRLQGKLEGQHFELLKSDYIGIEMSKLPKGLDTQGVISIDVV